MPYLVHYEQQVHYDASKFKMFDHEKMPIDRFSLIAINEYVQISLHEAIMKLLMEKLKCQFQSFPDVK